MSIINYRIIEHLPRTILPNLVIFLLIKTCLKIYDMRFQQHTCPLIWQCVARDRRTMATRRCSWNPGLLLVDDTECNLHRISIVSLIILFDWMTWPPGCVNHTWQEPAGIRRTVWHCLGIFLFSHSCRGFCLNDILLANWSDTNLIFSHIM